MMKKILSSLVILCLMSCNSTSKTNHSQSSTQKETPDAQVALQFIQDYNNFINSDQKEISELEWLKKRKDVTPEFVEACEVLYNLPEVDGDQVYIDADPILLAQDVYGKPYISAINNANTVLIMDGDFSDYQTTVYLKKVGNTWLVDGAGIVNPPKISD